MFKNYFAMAALLFASFSSYSQAPAVNKTLVADSLTKDNEAEDAADSSADDKPSSTLLAGFGIGKQLYSTHNRALNSKLQNPPLVFTPAVQYLHKSGFNIAASTYLFNEDGKFGVNQYAITPGYETLPGTAFDFSIAYTHYFIKNKYSVYSSPIQDDIYSSLVYTKTWLQPGIALGYSRGNAYESIHYDTTINRTKSHLYDSTTNTLSVFSTVLSVEHTFEWEKLLHKSDKLTLSPALKLNLGSSNTSTVDNDNLNSLFSSSLTNAQIKAIRKGFNKRVKKLSKLQSTSFTAESVGLDLQANYTIGNFSIEPDFYLDYYLPQTTDKRLTNIFMVNFNYSF